MVRAGRVPYEQAWAQQRAIHADVVAGTAPDTVLLLEHPAVYTAGKRTEPAERPLDGTPVVDVDRGGKITWHGPGQLVGYPILRLGQPLDRVPPARPVPAPAPRALRRRRPRPPSRVAPHRRLRRVRSRDAAGRGPLRRLDRGRAAQGGG